MNSRLSRPQRMHGSVPLLRPMLTWLAAIAVAGQMMACSTAPASAVASPAAAGATTEVEATYGIKVEGLRLTAAGSMLDFRYRVLDAQKAAPFLNGKIRPALFDEARGARLGVPDTPKLGRIRQTSRNGVIHTDRSYFIMFGNPGKALQSGDKVTLLLGTLKVTELRVQ